MKAEWEKTTIGYKVEIGEGALRISVYRDEGWRVRINDRVVKYAYPDEETAKKGAIGWAKSKLSIMEAQLKELENPIR